MKSSIFSRLILLCCFVLALTSAKAQYASIPDSSFRAALFRLGYGSSFDSTQLLLDTTSAAVLTADSMDISVSSIPDITGIRYFKHLKYLNCYHNPFTFLPRLPDSLTTLLAYESLLTFLPALPNTLRYLNIGDNSLTNLPHLPDSLRFLSVQTNLITVIPTLPHYLNYLTCYGNTISSLPALPDSLTFLDCGVNALSSLPTLPSTLSYLSCGINALDSLPALPSVLTRLYCNNNNLRSIPSLPVGIERLNCFANQLSSLPALPASLTWLDCSYNLISTLPTLPDSMHSFSCRVNMNLYCLPQLKKIVYLSFDSTSVSCLPDFPQENVSCTPALNTITTCGPININGCLTYAGIAEIGADQLSIYPNPASDIITVKINSDHFAAEKYTITDLQDRELLSGTLESSSTSIHVNGLSSGVYLLHIGSALQKLVKD